MITAADLLAPAGAALATGFVAGYFAYTLGGAEGLAPALLRPRQVGMAAALGLSSLGLSLRPGPLSAGSTAITTLALAYAWKRQWLYPSPGPRAERLHAALPDDTTLLVLPGARALPLGWVRRHRVIQCQELSIVQCGIARSLAVLRSPGGRPMFHLLPHATGFFVSDGQGEWDGVDGAPRRGSEPLQRLPAQVTSLARFRSKMPEGTLFGPPGDEAISAPPPQRPRVPGARGIEDAMGWGYVDEAGWHPAADHDSEASFPEGDPPTFSRYFLSRWAARRRGLPGA